jgi:hypothetical protein
MSNRKKILGISAIAVLSIVLVSYLIMNEEDKPFNQITIEYNNSVFNNNLPPYYDTILYTGLNAAGIVGITLTVDKLSDVARNQFDGELKAHIRYFNNMYYLFIDNYDRQEAIEVIAHELIHIQQYNSGDLIYYDGKVWWKGEEFDLSNIEYTKRPWEDDAFANQSQMISTIENILYY